MRNLVTILTILVLTSCSNEPENSIPDDEGSGISILVVGHTRNELPSENYLDPRLYDVAQQEHDLTILTGDMAFHTTSSQEVLDSLDELFNLGSDYTLFAPGNHDYDSLELLTSYTKKKYPIDLRLDRVVVFTLDSEKDSGNVSKQAIQALESLNPESFDHLILVSHKLIWMRDGGPLEKIANQTLNGELGSCNWCLDSVNFYSEVYPVLQSLKNSGVNVVCIAGDVGKKVTSFEHKNEDGVLFLASGFQINGPAEYLIIKINGKSFIYTFEQAK